MNIRKPHSIILSKKYPDRYFDLGTLDEFPHSEINRHLRWYKEEYDNNENVIYVEYYDGEWEKYEYDTDGNQIYYENDNDYWIKSEYDADGNEIYREYRCGYIEDNRI